ncbi:hypothetical protein H6G06_18960 [Anabaena sphaerica FACHB-251]|uniref:HNH endonuclease 5 domain-containing protein n=1 Tax=Anabaena sphaerica FACHB-251 TaxID=2692883 RepID=A0A927A2K8_9NOST|nr:HNH endonuclease [Anabaena sphaerica]MBD2295493.1 hypothetical protein [Anabaena sphaerica FACHB-251]
MPTCYVCDCEITENNTYEEHIILNALGGKLVSPSIICATCAKNFDSIDTSLSNQLNFAGLFLDIKRDRGKNPNIKVKQDITGKEFLLKAGGKPFTVRPIIDNQQDGRIFIKAKDENEMRTVLNGLKRKNPWIQDIDIEGIINKANRGQEYLDQPFTINIQLDNTTFRAICKMITSFYMQNGGNRQNILHLLPYILGESQVNSVFHYYPDRTLTSTNDSFQILHQLFIQGNSTEKIIYGYVELFSTFKFLVIISDDYNGNDFYKAYSFDVINRVQIEPDINLNLCKDSILEIKESQQENINKFQEALNEFKFFIYQKQSEQHISDIVQESIDDLFTDIQESAIPSQDRVREDFTT